MNLGTSVNQQQEDTNTMNDSTMLDTLASEARTALDDPGAVDLRFIGAPTSPRSTRSTSSMTSSTCSTPPRRRDRTSLSR
jgi:hypothetical protein